MSLCRTALSTRWSTLAAAASLIASAPLYAAELEPIQVIGTTPLQSVPTPLKQVPANIQEIHTDDLAGQNPLEVSEALTRNLPSVNMNALTNNPYQNDITYRGFLASSLLGSQVGLSVYLDGVRINEAFGDTVNWDGVPQSALSGIALIPGSNPVYGLNTLGGALALHTRDGVTFDRTELSAQSGSWGRNVVQLEHGGFAEEGAGIVDWYFNAHSSDEDGWREESPTDVEQFFAKLGRETETGRYDISLLNTNNDLFGNGVAPESLLDQDREAVFTFPDQSENSLQFLNFTGRQAFDNGLSASGNLFFRNFKRKTFNGDAELECIDDNDDEIVEIASGEAPHPGLCNNANVANLEVDGGGAPVADIELEAEAEERRTHTESDTVGGAFELTRLGPIAGHDNRVTVGLNLEDSDTEFRIQEREAEFEPKGLSQGTSSDEDYETEVDLESTTKNLGLYFTDTLALNAMWDLTVSGRYQKTRITLRDKSGEEPELNGNHTFQRFSPAAGLTFNPNPNLTWFGGYSEGFRAPTAAELTCADEEDPCALPNSFVADPPLDPVIAKTFEFGARGTLPAHRGIRWSAAIFRTKLEDDLLFTQTSSGSLGFFQNVGDTRRQGLELGLQGETGPVSWFAYYGYLEATFQVDTTLASIVDPNGTVVRKGDHIPLIPEHTFKLGADWQATEKFSLGTTLNYTGSQYLRGDEGNNQDKVDDYVLVNLHGEYQANQHLSFFGKVDNVFDSDYETGGVYNRNAFAALQGGDGVGNPEVFLAPGAPRAGWIGLKLTF